MRSLEITALKYKCGQRKNKLKKKLSCDYDSLSKTKVGTMSKDQIAILLVQC